MNNFLLIFRMNASAVSEASPQQFEDRMKQWQHWLGAIAARNKLVDAGNRLSPQGQVLKPDDLLTDGPYVELKESVGGYTIIRAESSAEAAEMSKGCPILAMGGSVELREIIPM